MISFYQTPFVTCLILYSMLPYIYLTFGSFLSYNDPPPLIPYSPFQLTRGLRSRRASTVPTAYSR